MSVVSVFKRGIMMNRIPFVPFILFGFLCCPIANDFFWKFFFYVNERWKSKMFIREMSNTEKPRERLQKKRGIKPI
ncbi:hypothetical protein PROCOU_02339 [Listeria rocourtiae FSL F6-920]|nr:hypothetical protein PROCOU_02339 [Listeria rocourtiae FSL F6-920]